VTRRSAEEKAMSLAAKNLTNDERIRVSWLYWTAWQTMGLDPAHWSEKDWREMIQVATMGRGEVAKA
jgi:hypothetical protein